MTIQEFIAKKPHLVWSTKDYEHLSEAAIVEAVLNFGDFTDVKKLFSILGTKKVAKIFRQQLHRPRTNYDPKIANYFQLYFQKHAA